MEKEHIIINCWCKQQEDRPDYSETGKDKKREEALNGYPKVEYNLNEKPF